MHIVITLIIRKEHENFFADMGYQTAPDAWPWRICSNQLVVQRRHEFENWPPPALNILRTVNKPFKGCCVMPAMKNRLISEEYLIASDGRHFQLCPSHGLEPCVAFHQHEDGAVLEAGELVDAGRFADFWDHVSLPLNSMRPVTVVA